MTIEEIIHLFFMTIMILTLIIYWRGKEEIHAIHHPINTISIIHNTLHNSSSSTKIRDREFEEEYNPISE